MADSYITVGSTGHKKALIDLGAAPASADPTAGRAYGDAVGLALYPNAPVITVYTPTTTAYKKVVPNAANLDMVIRARTSGDDLQYCTACVHLIADATTIAATVPATAGALAYALSIELADDLHTHAISTVYHAIADTALVTTNASDEATLVAEVNLIRAKLLTHLASTTIHSGTADAVNLAIVAATSACTDAATALTVLNTIYPAYVAHILVASYGAAYVNVMGGKLDWPCLGTLFVRTSTSGASFTTQEWRTA